MNNIIIISAYTIFCDVNTIVGYMYTERNRKSWLTFPLTHVLYGLTVRPVVETSGTFFGLKIILRSLILPNDLGEYSLHGNRLKQNIILTCWCSRGTKQFSKVHDKECLWYL